MHHASAPAKYLQRPPVRRVGEPDCGRLGSAFDTIARAGPAKEVALLVEAAAKLNARECHNADAAVRRVSSSMVGRALDMAV